MGAGGSTLLSRLLLDYGLVSAGQLEEALQTHETTQEPLGRVLVSAGLLEPRDLELVLRAQARLRGRPESSLPHVLIVDDDPEVGAVLGEFLNGFGYSVGIAQNGAEAMAAVSVPEEVPPAVMVLDLALPGVGGLSLLAQMRRYMGDHVPVIVLTGHPELEAETRARAGRLGIIRFATKPISARALLTMIQDALDGAPAGA